MYLQTLKILMVSRALSQADIARLAHVSRAAVCKWLKTPDGICNMEMQTLINLSEGLKVAPESLVKKIEDLSPLTALFLWDNLYPSMESFAAALAKDQLPAIARLVQVAGFHAAAKIVGKKAVILFPRYKKYIKPVRRKALESIWPLYQPGK